MFKWVEANNSNQGSTGNKKNFTKFQEGVTEIRLLLDNGERPHMRWTHWMPQFSRKITCPGKGCPIDDLIRTAKANKTTPPYASSKSFSFNIWNYATGKHEIMEEGVTMVESLQDFLSETFEEFVEDGQDANIKDIIIKVRKKKNSSGKFVWSFSLKQIAKMEPEVEEAFKNRYDLDEYYTAPSIDQVQQLLEVNASNPKEYIDKYNVIMGYAKPEDKTGLENSLKDLEKEAKGEHKDPWADDEDDIGVEVE